MVHLANTGSSVGQFNFILAFIPKITLNSDPKVVAETIKIHDNLDQNNKDKIGQLTPYLSVTLKFCNS